jgi:hypothetical protein
MYVGYRFGPMWGRFGIRAGAVGVIRFIRSRKESLSGNRYVVRCTRSVQRHSLALRQTGVFSGIPCIHSSPGVGTTAAHRRPSRLGQGRHRNGRTDRAGPAEGGIGRSQERFVTAESGCHSRTF